MEIEPGLADTPEMVLPETDRPEPGALQAVAVRGHTLAQHRLATEMHVRTPIPCARSSACPVPVHGQRLPFGQFRRVRTQQHQIGGARRAR